MSYTFDKWLSGACLTLDKDPATEGEPVPQEEIVGVVEAEFDVVEKRQYGELGPSVIVFQPR